MLEESTGSSCIVDCESVRGSFSEGEGEGDINSYLNTLCSTRCLNNAFQCKQSVEDEMLTEQKYLSIFVFFLRRNSAVLDLLFKLSLDQTQPHTYLITDQL